MGLKSSYTMLAPIYDAVVSSATESMRIQSLQRIDTAEAQSILINGIGTGLDIPFLPGHHSYTATDITPAMLNRCQRQLKKRPLNIKLLTADAMDLPFPSDSYDSVVMNLILAVVPDPLKALQEAIRVVKPGGKIYIMDKFLRPGQLALLRRFANLFMRHIATRTDVVFEDLLEQCTDVTLLNDRPALMGGWFRLIDLERRPQ